MNLIDTLFKRKEKDKNNFNLDKTRTLSASILEFYGFSGFDHQTNFVDDVAENNADLFNSEINVNNEKMNNYLLTNDYYGKNWLSIFNKSKKGVTAYLIYIVNDSLQFQNVNIQEREYDLLGNLTKCSIFYESYNIRSIDVQLHETYSLVNNIVTITRNIFEIQNELIKDKLDFENHKPNPNMSETQVLNINYIPIAVMKNKRNEMSDCARVMEKIKVLDVIIEQIILDAIMASQKFMFKNIYGNNQSLINDAIRQLVTKNVFVANNDAGLFDLLPANFKGKNLTDIFDWCVNEISKRVKLHIPSQKKSAQQSVPESQAVNINTVNAIHQKLLQYKQDTINFLKLLARIDMDLLNSKNFGFKNIDEINKLTIEYDVINPVNNQLVSDLQGKVNNDSRNQISAQTTNN